MGHIFVAFAINSFSLDGSRMIALGGIYSQLS